MKKLLTFLLCGMMFALAGCKKDTGSGPVGDGKIDILVCMHQYEEGEGSVRCIVAMLPDGSQKRYLYSGSESFSPKQGSIGSDGKTLLMACDDDTGVRTYNLATQTTTMLTGEGDYEVPVFSPDMGKVYVFYNDTYEFIVIDAATKSVTVLDSENDLIYPSFKKDGETMIVDYGWNVSIASIAKDGTNLTMLKEADEDIWYQHPLFVPALDKVIYIKHEDEEGDTTVNSVCLMNADGSGEVALITSDEVEYSSPSISNDGKKLAFADNNKNIFVAALNGNSIGTPQTISERLDNLWRPQYNRIDKEIFESLPEFVRPAVE